MHQVFDGIVRLGAEAQLMLVGGVLGLVSHANLVFDEYRRTLTTTAKSILWGLVWIGCGLFWFLSPLVILQFFDSSMTDSPIVHFVTTASAIAASVMITFGASILLSKVVFIGQAKLLWIWAVVASLTITVVGIKIWMMIL